MYFVALAAMAQLASFMTMLSAIFNLNVVPMFVGLAIAFFALCLVGYVAGMMLNAPRLEVRRHRHA